MGIPHSAPALHRNSAFNPYFSSTKLTQKNIRIAANARVARAHGSATQPRQDGMLFKVHAVTALSKTSMPACKGFWFASFNETVTHGVRRILIGLQPIQWSARLRRKPVNALIQASLRKISFGLVREFPCSLPILGSAGESALGRQTPDS
jgi:hypothetical protein